MQSVQSHSTVAQQEALARAREQKKTQKAAIGEDDIPSTYSKLGNLRYSILAERVLPFVNMVSLSVGNVLAMRPQKMTVNEKQPDLVALLEFVSGEPGTMPQKGAMKKWGSLLSHLQQCASLRGRTANLCLPVAYETD
eukprot:2974915-Amphidinium_carterae.1